jgi:para-nitrobenzyl esterase
MVAYWSNFFKTGDPNGEGLPLWRPCTDADPFYALLK